MASRWEFYDQASAFPTLWPDEVARDRSLVAEIHVGLNAKTDKGRDDGTEGEFSFTFHDYSGTLSSASMCCRLNAYEDAWRVLFGSSALVTMLAELGGTSPSPEDVRRKLLDLGMVDRSAELAARQ